MNSIVLNWMLLMKILRKLFGLGASVALVTFLSLAAVDWAVAQAPAPSKEQTEQAKPATASAARLPADSTSEHTLDLPGRALKFKAVAGSIPILNEERETQAEIAYVHYERPEGVRTRPVTFVFNGGPGSASAWLQLGALGPWRLPLENLSPSTPPNLVANAETWLDFTDLVFIDPAGAGYSRVYAKGDARKRLWSVDGDAESLAVFIRKWTEKNSRETAPKFMAGESYGGFRAPKILRALRGQGLGVAGLVLISPVLDFGWRSGQSPLAVVSRLPSMAAARLEADAPFNREALRDVERYAASDYLVDLMRGARDRDALERISAKVAGFTGLDLALVRKLGGRVDSGTFLRERERDKGRVGSSYDATVTTLDPNPSAANSHADDAFTGAVSAPLTTAIVDLYRRVLKWNVEGERYNLLSRDANSNWDWGSGRASQDVVGDLRNALAIDPRLRVLIAHGAADLVTPYFENQLLINQFPTYDAPDRLSLSVFGGGHMFYSRDASRKAFRNEVERLYRAVQENAAPRG